MLESRNPAGGQLIARFDAWAEGQCAETLSRQQTAFESWRRQPVSKRCDKLKEMGALLRSRAGDLAPLMAREMGKPIREARAEIEKCAWGCEFFAENAAAWLADEVIATDAERSLVAHEPLGIVLAVMPWNFPFWQVFRAAAPILAAGNVVALKHASNVPQCALAIDELFVSAGFPADVLRSYFVEGARTNMLIADPRVRAVTLTGSEQAGREVAAIAGQHRKKCVLELGGSDPLVVLDDADLDAAVNGAIIGRFQNSGQSCIAAKRLIVAESVADEFVARFRAQAEKLVVGDPLDEKTQIGPLARADLREQLHRQVEASIAAGAVVITGARALDQLPGWYYAPTILDRVHPGMPAADDEIFGPVAAIMRARDDTHALELANLTRFGLGGSVWTRDAARGERFARALECGAAFVNGVVKSDPRLPFGGIKDSGYGRELSRHGLMEFVNLKTVWMGPRH
jgi:succinate-semialdehyde dehydrogenase/glutarate-semialdehyde dehydrogenase